MRWKNAPLHRAVEMPSWRDKLVIMAVECLVYEAVCYLPDPAPVHISVPRELIRMRWQREDFLHLEMSVRAKTTVRSLHRQANMLMRYISLGTRGERSNRRPSLVFRCFERCGPGTADGR
ncbi:unnamed protein product [Rangifer tarandus platyrhynchus]|uniref:Uncharacterized protein n=1 Tax=Rangifer tarandus platyrhynchus TaxID=3082113 RepID=A0ABN8XMR7_RANTA|nr:unnamed protein product [Rangifer tarandus platyrhynchus]